MDQYDQNPYESPRSVGNDSKPAVSGLLRGVIRVLLLGMSGFGSFAGFGFLYSLMSDQATLPWMLAVGMLGALAFSLSEIFNAGPGKEAGVVRRILVAIVVLFASLILSAVIADAIFGTHQSYDSDPKEMHKTVVSVAVLTLALIATRIVWTSAQSSPKPSA